MGNKQSQHKTVHKSVNAISTEKKRLRLITCIQIRTSPYHSHEKKHKVYDPGHNQYITQPDTNYVCTCVTGALNSK